MRGILYIVATPIGNLEDITLRALRILKEVDLIAAEDTRNTLKLLNHFEISKPLISYHRHSNCNKEEEIIEKLKCGINIALVSDAGTPVISDPGEELVKRAIEENIKIIPIPGACAAINALIVSGIDAKEFSFIGFLPLNKKLRTKKLNEIKDSLYTTILYEAPHKLSMTLNDLKEILNDRKIAVIKEITKIHEEFLYGTVDEIIEKMENPRGEYVIVIEAVKEIIQENNYLNNLSVEEHYKYYEKKGMYKKDIIKQIAKDRNINKNEIYMKFIN